MYYYIMEPANGKSSVNQDKIKDLLGDLGIAGETVFPSPARTIEELASLGILKGYSTIVAVGSEKIVNKIVTALINQKSTKDTVLGVIPDDFNSKLAKRIGVSNIKEACESLKYRKLETVDAVCIEPNKFFMTEAILESNKTSDAYLIMDEIQAGIAFNRITIKPGVRLEVEDASTSKSNGLAGFLGSLFGKKKEQTSDIYASLFITDRVQIETPGTATTIMVDNEPIAKTPVVMHARPKALKIIVARDSIS